MANDPNSYGPSRTQDYLCSGIPYASSSTVTPGMWTLNFPFVTQHVAVFHASGTTSSEVRVAFTQNGLNGSNNIRLPAGASYSADLRLTRLFISGAGSVVSVGASLTEIPTGSIPTLTGSSDRYPGVG